MSSPPEDRTRRPVTVRRAGDLLLLDPGTSRAAEPAASATRRAQFEVVECTASLSDSDGVGTMRLRLPRHWLEETSRVADKPVPRDVQIRRYAALSAVRLSEVAAVAGVAVASRSAPAWLEQARALLARSVVTRRSMRSVAEEVGVHPVHLSRCFKRHFGMTPTAYVATLRVERACGALLESERPMSRVAYESGFADQPHMTRELSASIALTPGELRRLSRP
ncbi:MAG TPA: AraC family transcriptional regulator [Gemmatimonadaceae bacterium]|nr:AraC family transcriptional regulator [Gemmatimonadaceae bacterium]